MAYEKEKSESVNGRARRGQGTNLQVQNDAVPKTNYDNKKQIATISRKKAAGKRTVDGREEPDGEAEVDGVVFVFSIGGECFHCGRVV